jgi:WXG100 family type VII secretion target
MNGGFQVNPNELQSASTSFNANVQQLEDTLRTITNIVEGLRASWKGTANESFEQAMLQWKTSVHNLNQALDVISQNVNKSGISYQDTENSINSAFKGLDGFK